MYRKSIRISTESRSIVKGFPRSEEEIPIWLFKIWKTNTAEICGIWLSINQDICILGEYRRKEPASCPDAGRLLGPKNKNRVLTTKVYCPIVLYQIREKRSWSTGSFTPIPMVYIIAKISWIRNQTCSSQTGSASQKGSTSQTGALHSTDSSSQAELSPTQAC